MERDFVFVSADALNGLIHVAGRKNGNLRTVQRANIPFQRTITPQNHGHIPIQLPTPNHLLLESKEQTITESNDNLTGNGSEAVAIGARRRFGCGVARDSNNYKWMHCCS